jgi:hypothetical protein
MRMGPGRGAVRASRHLGAFIERRLEAPWSDPDLGLTPERLLALSASPLERQTTTSTTTTGNTQGGTP